MLGGRAQLKTMSTTYNNTGDFTVHVDIGGEVDAYTQSETSIAEATPFGPNSPTAGTMIVDVGGKSTETEIRITSDDHLPTEISSLRYEVLYYRRGS
jgi:hypothetical protein